MPERGLTDGGALSARSKRNVVVMITIGALVILLLGAEGAIRLRQTLKYGTSSTLEDHYTVDPKINLRVPIANYSTPRISVNSLGFRGPEIAVPKPPGTIRLAFLGASATWCAEVSGNEAVWPHLVTTSLAKSFPAVQFDYVNGGVPGYTLESMLKSLRYRVAPLQPDVIVIYEAANNLSGELRELAVKGGMLDEETVTVMSWPGRYSLLWYLVEKNLRVIAAQREAAGAGRGRLTLDPGTLGEGYRQALMQLVVAAQETAKVVALATFSIYPRSHQSAEQKLRASSSALFYTPFVTPDTIIASYERYNDIIREVARDTGALLIEGEREIPGDALHFTDSVHFSDAGSVAMAQRVSLALAANPGLHRILADPASAR